MSLLVTYHQSTHHRTTTLKYGGCDRGCVASGGQGAPTLSYLSCVPNCGQAEISSQIYNEFTQDSKKKIDITNLENNHPLCSLRELAQATKQAREKCYGARNSWLKGVRRVIQALHKFAPVIDSFVQNQPHITALVWGCFRFLIQVSQAGLVASVIANRLLRRLPQQSLRLVR
jgi:hypothetical protein